MPGLDSEWYLLGFGLGDDEMCSTECEETLIGERLVLEEGPQLSKSCKAPSVFQVTLLETVEDFLRGGGEGFARSDEAFECPFSARLLELCSESAWKDGKVGDASSIGESCQAFAEMCDRS